MTLSIVQFPDKDMRDVPRALLPRTFLQVHRVPWSKEEGLLVWQAEDLALLALGRLPLGEA